MSKKEPEGIATEHRVMGDQTTLVVGALLLTESAFLLLKEDGESEHSLALGKN